MHSLSVVERWFWSRTTLLNNNFILPCYGFEGWEVVKYKYGGGFLIMERIPMNICYV